MIRTDPHPPSLPPSRETSAAPSPARRDLALRRPALRGPARPGRLLAALALVGAAAFGCYALIGCQPTAPQEPHRASIRRYINGVLAYQKGNSDQAIAAFEQAVALNPDLTMARDLLGDLYQDREDWEKAARQYEALCELDPYTPGNHYKLGLMNQLMSRMDKAIKSYLQAIKLNPNDWLSHMNLGMCYWAIKQPQEAVKYCRRATELNDKSARAWANLGVALDSLPRGQVAPQQQQAEEAYRKSLDLDTNQPHTMMYLAENLMRQGRHRQAHSVMIEVVKVENSPRAHKLLGDTMFLDLKYDDAIREYAAALKINPNFFQAYNEVGQVLMTEYHAGMDLDEKKRQLAIRYWKRSLEINPNQPKIQELVKQYSENKLFQE